MNIRFDDTNIYISTTDSHAIIPTKRDEDGCYDLYAAFYEDEFVIPPHTTKLVPTGIKSAFSPKYRVALRERGSNTKTHLIVRAGQIDSGYRGEWFAALYNDSDKPVVIVKSEAPFDKEKPRPVEAADEILVPYSMAICQFALEEVPQSSIIAVRDVSVFESERGEGKLGSSGK